MAERAAWASYSAIDAEGVAIAFDADDGHSGTLRLVAAVSGLSALALTAIDEAGDASAFADDELPTALRAMWAVA